MRTTTGGAFGGGRVTPQRQLIARLAESRGAAFTVDDLAELVRGADPSIGLATVYRAVTAMADAGFVERIGERDGAALFSRCEAPEGRHHHHVICESCGRVAEARCPLPPAASTGEAPGFVVTRHEVTLYGLCPDCVNRGS